MKKIERDEQEKAKKGRRKKANKISEDKKKGRNRR